jgi:hypothetical protein
LTSNKKNKILKIFFNGKENKNAKAPQQAIEESKWQQERAMAEHKWHMAGEGRLCHRQPSRSDHP